MAVTTTKPTKCGTAMAEQGSKRCFLGEAIKRDATQNLGVYVPQNWHLGATSKLRRRLHGWLDLHVLHPRVASPSAKIDLATAERDPSNGANPASRRKVAPTK